MASHNRKPISAIDILKNLMDPSKPLETIILPQTQLIYRQQDAAQAQIEESDSGEELEEADLVEEDLDHELYVRTYRERELQSYKQARTTCATVSGDGTMSEIHGEDVVSSIALSEVRKLNEMDQTEVYAKYRFDKSKIKKMAIESYREGIIDMINTNEVVIIHGPTGCGKTTQVPQFILDDCRRRNQPCSVIVTQPRRIAAISVARRVCEERQWSLGTVCGYQVGLEKNTSLDTILTYVTTGVLLQRLINQKSLREYTHIIIDEVHERNQDMDFLLLIVRRFLYLNSLGVKVILMSATIDVDEYAVYFQNYSGSTLIPAPVMEIAKPNEFSIAYHYIDQYGILAEIPEFSITRPEIHPKTYRVFVTLMRLLDRVTTPEMHEGKQVSVLVFLPGILEIEEAHRQLVENENCPLLKQKEGSIRYKWHIVPLHSSLPTEQQREVFKAVQAGQRKIILSTNIAESSITVPDVSFVIDFCLTKTMVVDPHTKYQSLQLEWASHVNLAQRAGRVGRTCEGRVYRLVTQNFYERELSKTITPEILRAPLDKVVLNAKCLNLNEPPKAILSLALNPPDLQNVKSTVLSLKETGALTVNCRGVFSNIDGDLTFLGKIMAGLPLDVKLSKLIILGHMFSCLREAIIMAAGCSLNNIFTTPFQERLKAYSNKLMWSDHSCSDLIALLNLYQVWECNLRSKTHSAAEEAAWLRQNYLSSRAMKEWHLLVKEITNRLVNFGIKETDGPGRVVLNSHEKPLVLKIIMCGAFYPNYFIRSSAGGQVDEKEAVKILGGRDPYRTVYFTNMDNGQPGMLYTKSIKDLFPEASNVTVSFDQSMKVYVQFQNDTQLTTVNVNGFQTVMGAPGKIPKEVYLAVRRRQLGIQSHIKVMAAKDAWERAEHLGIEQHSDLKTSEPLNSLDTDERPVLPELADEYIKFEITEKINAGHFWAQNIDESTHRVMYTLDKLLNTGKLQPVAENDIVTGQLYAAKFYDDGKHYRCKVIQNTGKFVQVQFIDYGNVQKTKATDIYVLPEAAKKFKPQAMECVLSEVEPSYVLDQKGLWTEEANKMFDRQTSGLVLYGKVYSVVDGIVHLELFRSATNCERSASLNEFLIQHGYAQYAEESYLSKENNAKRVQIQQKEEHQSESSTYSLASDLNSLNIHDFEAPSDRECRQKIELKGPFSPLEMSIYGITNSSLKKVIKIDPNSVNSVLLDTAPQNPNTRLVVAEYLGQNPSGTALNMRNTTVMPNIPGLAALMCLIFCPRMEPKPVPDGSYVGAILCGLGAYKDSHIPLYEKHDLMLILDTELNSRELSQINELRFWMNETVEVMECLSGNIVQPQTSMNQCQAEIKMRLFELLKMRRSTIPRTYMKYSRVWNKSVYRGEVWESNDAREDAKDIWPAHWWVKLQDYEDEQLKLKENLLELRDIAQGITQLHPNLKCELCDTRLILINDVRNHLISHEHKQQVESKKIPLNIYN